MKLLAFGDVHLGASPDLGTSDRPRLADQADTLRQIAAVAIEENVDGVLFAGDAFHHRRPTPPVLMVWREFTDALEDCGIPMVGIVGNHDVASLDDWTAPEVVERRGRIFRRPSLATLAGVRIACLPWSPVTNLVAKRNGGDRDAIHAEAAELLLRVASGLREEAEQAGGPMILLTHFSISGAVTPTGRDVGPDFGVVLPRAGLEDLGFDFVVAGHIHKAQTVGDRIFYTGSPGVVDWGEAAVEHGVWLIDTDVPARRFVSIEDRPFVTLDADLSLHPGPNSGRIVSMSGIGWDDAVKDDAVVRLRYTATADQARRIDSAAIREALHVAGASRVFIQPTIVREDRARVEGVDETLGPLEALALYCEHQSVNGDRAAAMAERTSRYLQEA